ncbi:MAG: MlaD family protein [Bacteroidaceae bacterium]|jgi:phospholipid/cholesterol/gamma-HCH transport system substrate-binding protein|nr:MlaD family protein [Bacteroidaceae bacterium]
MKSKEIKIAITAIIAVVIVYLGIIFMKGLKLFSSDNIYYVEMKNVGGLSKAGEVIANGMNIGVVKDITYDSNRQMLTVAVELNEGFSLPRNSHATTVKDMLGAPKMNIILGENPRDLLAKGDTISGEGGGDLMSSIGEMVPQLKALMPKLDSILTAVNTLTNDPALASSLHNMEYISNNLKATTDDVNRLMRHDVPQLMTHANSICSNIETTTRQLNEIDLTGMADNANATLKSANQVVSELQLFTNQLSNQNSSLGKLMNDPSIYNHLDSTMNNASRLLEDLRLHPSRYVHFSVFGRKEKK